MVKDNTIFDNDEVGIHVNGDASEGGVGVVSNALIEDNVIYDNGQNAINADGIQSSVIENNLIYDYSRYGICLYQIDAAGPSENNIIVNNTIDAGTTGTEAAISISDGGTGNAILNNILLGAGGVTLSISSDSMSGLVSNYNVVGTLFQSVDTGDNETLAQWQSATGQDEKSFTATEAQLFVNASAGNYQELATSPSVGAGTSTDAPATDIVGNPRPSPKGYDIGCYEYEPTPTPTSTATLLKEDTTTQGNWIGAYGSQGYDIIENAVSLPSYATVTPSGQSSSTGWHSSTTDPRALQTPSGSSRIAACSYSATSFTVDVNLTDGQTHDLALYFLDWDQEGRSERVQLTNAATGTVLDTETVSSFESGVYLQWAVSGNVLITFTRLAGKNAVLSGLFLDPASTSGGDDANQLGARSSINTGSPSSPSMAGPAIARGSSGGLTIVPAAGPVNAVLGALPEDDDATATAVGSPVHDLALQQVSDFAWGRRMSRRSKTDA